jgi:hypothetical protein
LSERTRIVHGSAIGINLEFLMQASYNTTLVNPYNADAGAEAGMVGVMVADCSRVTTPHARASIPSD